MEKKYTTKFVKGDIVTYDIEYVKRGKMETDNPDIQAQIIREIRDDGTILLGGFYAAIPSQYVLPIPIDSEIAKQIRYNEIKGPNYEEDIYTIPPFMDTLAKYPIFEQLQAANLQYVHEVQHWLKEHSMRDLVINVFYGMMHPVHIW